ncbi:MAG: rRNA maturation RNase YbeY [Proteobacteria bacterium]|nr:rRNA maturation RNase YbeY [Pseudomonadota bacterium]MDA1131724.1 rRNA maturation RNase YbeY [Pseudomonadota bacterium]
MASRIRVELVAPNDQWMVAIDDLSQLVTRTVRAAVEAANRVHGACEVCVVLSDDRELKILNQEYRNIDKPTNVLSFPGEPLDEDEGAYEIGGRPRVLGDIVIAYETMVRESEAASIPLPDHLAHILIHGVLHLCRFDHEIDDDAAKMEALEAAVLRELGIADPYAPDRSAPTKKSAPKTSARKKPLRKKTAKKGPAKKPASTKR